MLQVRVGHETDMFLSRTQQDMSMNENDDKNTHVGTNWACLELLIKALELIFEGCYQAPPG